MSNASIFLIVTLFIFIGLLVFYSFEDKKGRRIFLRNLRIKVDDTLRHIKHKLVLRSVKTAHQTSLFLAHHGLQLILKKLLKLVRSIESKLDRLIKRFKRRAKKIPSAKRSGRNHLDDIADHKEASALSHEQKAELRSK